MKHGATPLCIVSLACSGSALALWWCEAPSVAWMVWALAVFILAVALWTWREDKPRDIAPPCAGDCGDYDRSLCPVCLTRFLRVDGLREQANANEAALEWYEATARELSRRGAPDIAARRDT